MMTASMPSSMMRDWKASAHTTPLMPPYTNTIACMKLTKSRNNEEEKKLTTDVAMVQTHMMAMMLIHIGLPVALSSAIAGANVTIPP